jgi:branched-chain amino acid transport system ATP-binding protein
MLEIKKVSAGYAGIDVIHDLDLSVKSGEIVALIGANGAGKSTLVKTISGLLSPSAGEMSFDGQRIEGLNPRARVRLGIAHVPEGRQMFPGMTVAENLRLGAYSRGGPLVMKALRPRIEEVCQRFPILLERLNMPAGNLSGGQQQMLAIARGLMAEPKLLILDEPSLGLAPVLVEEIFRLIHGLKEQGLSILISEQNARMSLAVSDRAYVIEMGRVAMSGLGRDLLDNPEVAERYLGVGKAVIASDERQAKLTERLKAIFATPGQVTGS